MVLTTRELAEKNNLEILGKIISWATCGVDPSMMGLGPIPSSNKALEIAKWNVKDLDLITQFESGIKTVDKTDFNIYELIENVYDLMEFESEKNNTKLLAYNENNTPVIVNADKERILQVLTNLVVNSIKYGKEGGYTKVKVEEYDKDRIIVRVKDNGEGIEDEHLPRLFERFYRIDKNRSRKKGGSGLGLSIVKHIIEAHQEQIFVKSKIGQGTEFSFTLQKP